MSGAQALCADAELRPARIRSHVEGGAWTQYYLMEEGRWLARNVARCPRTARKPLHLTAADLLATCASDSLIVWHVLAYFDCQLACIFHSISPCHKSITALRRNRPFRKLELGGYLTLYLVN